MRWWPVGAGRVGRSGCSVAVGAAGWACATGAQSPATTIRLMPSSRTRLVIERPEWLSVGRSFMVPPFV